MSNSSQLLSFIDKTKYYLVVLICGVVLGACGCYWFTKGDQNNPKTNMSNSTSGLLSSTSVYATPKESVDAPDVVVSQQYTAVVNGEKVSVPVAKAVSNSTSQPNSPSGVTNAKAQKGVTSVPQGVTGHIDQTIDLTPVLKKLQPTWEVGAGYMYNSSHYGCVSIQRNYKENKAIEFTTFIGHGKVDGFMVQHKWLIR